MDAVGLDSVELVLECEEQFGIKIPDAEASKVVSVIDLYALICRLTEDQGPRSVRLAVKAATDLLRPYCPAEAPVEPTARLADLVPVKSRRAMWSNIERAAGRRLPRLVGPRWVGLSALVLSIGAVILGVAAQSVALALLGLLAVALIAIVLAQTMPCFPPSCATIQNVMDLVSPQRAEAMWHNLVAIISDQFGVPPSDITPTTRFVQDLKMR